MRLRLIDARIDERDWAGADPARRMEWRAALDALCAEHRLELDDPARAADDVELASLRAWNEPEHVAIDLRAPGRADPVARALLGGDALDARLREYVELCRAIGTPGIGGYGLWPSRMASVTWPTSAGSQSKSGNPWPRLTAPTSCASADMTVKIVVPTWGRRLWIVGVVALFIERR